MAEKKIKVKKKVAKKKAPEKKKSEKKAPAKAKKVRWVNASELSRIFAWDITTTKTLLNDGVIKRHRNYKYDLDECIKAIGDWKPELYGPSELEKLATEEIAEKKKKPSTFSEAKTKREKLRVEDLQMDIDLKKGILCIQIDEENKGYAAAQKAKDSLFGIADRLASRLAAESDVHKIREILNKQFTQICNELAGERDGG